MNNPVQTYVDQVLSSQIEVCRWARLACERHNRDLTRDDIYFDLEAAIRPLKYISRLKHYKGQWAGQPFRSELWQAFVVGSLFGWKLKETGERRFRYGYIEVPRKNGKTLLGAGVAKYLAEADGEAGAEVYIAATKEDQAKILFNDVVAMTQSVAEPEYLKRFRFYRKPAWMSIESTHSFIKPLSRESKSLDGLNPHGIVADELHAWTTPDLWNVLNSALGSRRQPLFVQITTAGNILHGVCIEQQETVKSILNGTFENDAYFGIIYTLDKEDLINDEGNRDLTLLREERLWKKANPNYGVSVLSRAAKEAYVTASAPSAAGNLFSDLQTKRFNIWVNAAESWIEILDWQECHEDFDPEKLKGMRCFGGLDLAQVRDLSAYALLFPPQEGLDRWVPLVHYWCPEENIDKRSKADRVPYREWQDKGYITATPGRVTDYNFIHEGILASTQRYDVVSVAFDRTFSGQMIQNLTHEGIDMVRFGQGFVSMSTPCNEFHRMVLGQEINHLNNPVLTWNVENAVVRRDPAGNIKIDKGDTKEEKRRAEKKRVDGLVATVMALGLRLAEDERAPMIGAL